MSFARAGFAAAYSSTRGAGSTRPTVLARRMWPPARSAGVRRRLRLEQLRVPGTAIPVPWLVVPCHHHAKYNERENEEPDDEPNHRSEKRSETILVAAAVAVLDGCEQTQKPERKKANTN
jgi:hypothetical protein